MDKKYEIGNFIYQLRTERGYTQKELGALLSVTDKAVSKWETGAAVPRMKVLRQLAAALGCTPEELLLGRRSGNAGKPEESTESTHREIERGESERRRKRWRRRVRNVLLCALAVLTVLVCVLGLRQGVWSGSVFFSATRDGERTTYVGRDRSRTAEVLRDGEQGAIEIRSGEDGTATFPFEVAMNGSVKTVKITSENGDAILRGTYSAGKWMVVKAGDTAAERPDGDLDLLPAGFSDEAILNMAAENVGNRLSGKRREVLLGTLFLLLGLAVNEAAGLVTVIDRELMTIFYEGARGLRASEATQIISSVLGIAVFVLGAVFYRFVLFS